MVSLELYNLRPTTYDLSSNSHSNNTQYKKENQPIFNINVVNLAYSRNWPIVSNAWKV
jgi:hypothetical protein